MHLLGEDFSDALIDEANLLEGKFLSKVTLEVALGWKPINHKELLVFLGLAINMDLIIKRSMKAFWNTKDLSQKPATSFVLEHFLLETGYPPTE